MKKAYLSVLRLAASFFLALALLICLFSFSPIFDFGVAKPFSGPDIYNPYASLPASPEWKRANFHTHTRVDNILNECPEYPQVVYDDYMKMRYDILAFSNHNLLTRHPYDSTLQINVYEHGYSIFKFHKLVFNPSRMMLYDHILPLLVSQKQWQYDLLSRDADFLVMNHPDRSLHTTLVRKFFEIFFEKTNGNSCQIIATTHDYNIMDLDLFRQDEIWFVERQKDHSSSLYSLNKYKARFDKKVNNDYLLGKYGAVPQFLQKREQEVING